jgi:nitrite reductase/ring-hydroxylating ferredoxin subunit
VPRPIPRPSGTAVARVPQIRPSNRAIGEANRKIVDIVIDSAFFGWKLEYVNDRGANAVAGGNGMTITQRDRDLGTGYAMKPSTTRTELTSVGRGTPMGELLRRYWHPVGLVSDATDIPRKVRVLGEDLVLFRDKHGRPGLLHARCCHRGTTLYYGKVEEDGIRCCYHGWKFDTEGHCLEQPCEPEGGLFKDKVRQPWYPLQERYGLIFAYLGSAEKKAGSAALRMPGEDGRRRVRRSR